MSLTYRQTSTTSSTTTVGLTGTSTGSLLIATCLIVSDVSNPNPFITDNVSNSLSGILSQSPASYNSTFNNMYTFGCFANKGGSPTFTLNYTGSGTLRFWVNEFTGQASGNPIFAAAGVVFGTTGTSATIALDGTGAVPMTPIWSNMTAICTTWNNPPTSAQTQFDGGAGVVAVSGTSGGAMSCYRNNVPTLAPYAPTITFTSAQSANNGTGGLLLVKSTSSLPVGAGLLLGVG